MWAYGGQSSSRTNVFGFSDQQTNRVSHLSMLVGTAGVGPTLPRYQHGVLTIRRHSNILALSRLTLGLALHSLPHSVITPKNQVLVDESRSAIISLLRPWDDNVRTAGLQCYEDSASTCSLGTFLARATRAKPLFLFVVLVDRIELSLEPYHGSVITIILNKHLAPSVGFGPTDGSSPSLVFKTSAINQTLPTRH